ncbi:MAG: cyclase family protein [Saprospiraceae bacterium]|nr:cyclase family protein [Saprospiraceae bacterium]
MRYVDLSHEIFDGLITYKGLPAPLICDFLTREASRSMYDGDTSFSIGKVEMVGNSGTYMDCPFHRYADGKDFSELFVSDLADLLAVKVSVPHQEIQAIDRKYFEGLNLTNKAVLIETGWSKFWNTDRYFEGHPFVTSDAAQYLFENKVKLVGIDSYNIDDTRQNSRPAHSILLANDIPIVEHMCQLHLVPKSDFFFTAVPPKIKAMGSFPVRAFAKF